MNKDQIAGKWQQLKGEVKKQWGLLTDDQIEAIEGDRQKLAGLLRERYGIAEEEAEDQINAFYDRLDSKNDRAA